MNSSKKVVIFGLLLAILSAKNANCASIGSDNFMDSLQTGFKFATKLLGMDQSNNVASLVAQAFASAPSRNEENRQDSKPEQDKENLVDYSTEKQDSFPVSSQQQEATTEASTPGLSGLFGGVLRVLGLDDAKISALVINGLIFMAQMIEQMVSNRRQNSFTSDKTSRSNRGDKEGEIWDRILTKLESVNEREILNLARNKNLTKIITENHDSFSKSDSDCIQLLLCKISPVVWKMQDAIGKRIDEIPETETASGSEFFIKDLPSQNEFRAHGLACENRFPQCNLEQYQSP